MLQQLSRQLTPQSLVELSGGRAITVDPEANLERQPETIRRFVGETLILLLTSSPKQPQKTVWEISSVLLADEFKPKFDAEMMDLNPSKTPRSNNQKTENVLVIRKIFQPTKIGEGKWKVEMLANQLVFSSSDLLGKSIPFNRQVLVRAIERQAASLPDEPLPWHLATYRLSEARLEIYNICPIKEKICK